MSPYPNFTPSLIKNCFDSNQSISFIIANPACHSFINSHGFKRYIPYLHYSALQSSLYRVLQTLPISSFDRFLSRLQVNIYTRDAWTFHSKGIWLEFFSARSKTKQELSGCYVGSSNLSYRSYHRDLEVGFLFVTSTPKYQQVFRKDYQSLSRYISVDSHMLERLHKRQQHTMGNVITTTQSVMKANLSRIEHIAVNWTARMIKHFL
jgi:phosphatidylserine/phosphatidylglycerophosphate/cardiolipin synthase-like enzyme